jgi:hypothetical protein
MRNLREYGGDCQGVLCLDFETWELEEEIQKERLLEWFGVQEPILGEAGFRKHVHTQSTCIMSNLRNMGGLVLTWIGNDRSAHKTEIDPTRLRCLPQA